MSFQGFTTIHVFSSFLKKKACWNKYLRLYCKTSSIDEESLFVSPKVQTLLTRITGFDIDKILKAKPIKDVETPKYKLLTTQQLKEMEEESQQKARHFLQMPPYMKPWKTEMQEEDIISNDDLIDSYDKHESSYAFVDISPGIKLKERSVVVREVNGVLRNGIGEERDNLLNIYYPREGKMTYMPEMFQPSALEGMLTQQRYEYVLTRACVQFEPDDPHYIRVTHRTFEHILTTGQFEQLRSTRFFGTMTFYYLVHHNIDSLLCHTINQSRFEDAVDMVSLYHIIHPSCPSAQKCSSATKPMELLKAYIKEDAKEKMALQLSLEVYESTHATQDQKTVIN